ncbi:MAG: 2-succinyl-5-enolpyruvyl-6-hydroxy-3-cyclohexene-1-carboxylic-acid synthase [Flavobacteriales bacterium]|nr:2-succinyl-5-enolpyruvyl-6-hydroxy-3-cyclohexene-1-carboxylic-acid synthase [Flavobacteriales bacterium]
MQETKNTHSTIHQAQILAQIFVQKGIHHVVISSGSRNAPLTIELTATPNIKCYSIIDERSAAFFAIGIAKELKEPVAIVCTSGSALLNYYPAVSEAFYSRIPLIIVSADRPEDMIDRAMGQTIHQKNVLSLHTVFNTSLSENEEDIEKNAMEIDLAINQAIIKSAPVHINIPLSEPLYETTSKVYNIKSTTPVFPREETEKLDEIRSIWTSSNRKMILCGCYEKDEELEKTLHVLCETTDTILLCESTSNLHSDMFIDKIDQAIIPLNEAEEKELYPDLLITMGGMVVSKKIKSFLQRAKPKYHVHINHYTFPDTFYCLSHSINISNTVFFNSLLNVIHEDKNYSEKWLSIKNNRLPFHKNYIEKAPFSDLKVWDIISKTIPEKTHIEIANSSSIRYSQLFDFQNNTSIFCNRGTSGIDGCTSTAMGVASVCKENVTFITGDLSFFYDSNALWNNYIPSSTRIILINNKGGGIFKILNGSRTSDCCSQFLEAKHTLDASHIAKMHSWIYKKSSNEEELNTIFKTFFNKSKRPKILEIFTPEDINDTILHKYFISLK